MATSPTPTSISPTVAFAGNQIILKIGNKIIGLAQDLQATENFRPEPVSGLGSPRVQEYVPSMYEISISMSACLINSPAAGLMDGGGNPSTEMGKISDNIPDVSNEPNARKWLNENMQGVDIQVLYTREDQSKPLRTYSNCVFESADVSVRKHGILMANARFKAAYVSDGDWGKTAITTDTSNTGTTTQ